MNRYLKSILLKIQKNSPGHVLLCKLIDKIMAYDGDLVELSITRLFGSTVAQTEGNDLNNKEEESFHDYRIRFLGFKNFRAFPDNRKFTYGLMFTNTKDEVSSLYLVGRNSTGKSSIYCALEYLYSGKVSNAEERNVPKENQIKYLTYGFGQIKGMPDSEVGLWMDMTDKHKEQLAPLGLIKPLCPSAMFCSNYDVEIIEKCTSLSTEFQYEENLHNYILEQLGYDDFYKLVEGIKKLLGKYNRYKTEHPQEKVDEVRDISSVIDVLVSLISYEADEEKLERLSKYASAESIETLRIMKQEDKWATEPNWGTYFADHWNTFERNISLAEGKELSLEASELLRKGREKEDEKTSYRNAVNSLFARLISMYRLLYQTYSKFNGSDNIKRLSVIQDLEKKRKQAIEDTELLSLLQPNEKEEGQWGVALQELLTELLREKDKLIKKFETDLGPFLVKTLSFYSEKHEEFNVETTNDSFKIWIKVKDHEGKELFESTPAMYLNSFRYRLYCVSLKIAMAFYYMKLNNSLLPIVIDDMFNASDFENTQAIEYFVNKIYETYQTVVGFKQSLQLIMLTHDEMVLEAFRNGTSKHSSVMLTNIIEKKMDDPATRFCCGRMFPYWEAEKIHRLTLSSKKYYQIYMRI